MIKWLKGYLILSTYAKDISNQSCITNRETPCRMRLHTEHPGNTLYLLTYAVLLLEWASRITSSPLSGNNDRSPEGTN